MASRLDKYVWCVRLSKTRSQASEAISKGRIKLNNQQVKPSKEPKVGDTLHFLKNTAIFSFKIIQLLDNRIGAKLVSHPSTSHGCLFAQHCYPCILLSKVITPLPDFS